MGRGTPITIGMGYDSGIRDWTRFVVVKPGTGGSGMRAGRILTQGETYVQLRVERVSDVRTVGIVVPETAGSRIEPGDFVYTR